MYVSKNTLTYKILNTCKANQVTCEWPQTWTLPSLQRFIEGKIERIIELVQALFVASHLFNLDKASKDK